ncbi:MAG: phosphatase PAP2 family protein [Tissierellia bacterium]|nr:phosphatase PAP2 family protein [Tissierellia bacterium]
MKIKLELEKQEKIILIIYLIIFILIGINIRHSPNETLFDKAVYEILNPIMENKILHNFSKAMAFIGSVKFILPLMLILIPIKIRKKENLNAFKLLSASLLAFILNEILKHIHQRQRPSGMLVDQWGLSFPSGHSMISMCMYLTIAELFFEGKKRTIAKIIALIFSFLMAISRVILYVHYPTDVLAGLILGYILYVAIKRLQIYKKNQNDLEEN